MTDLKGKNIGVISMGSAGVQIARALAATAGMDPVSDINVVVAGEGAQTAAMVRSRQVEALSQYDTQYAMVENASSCGFWIPRTSTASPPTGCSRSRRR
jgi:NitT/TauT family transport system substrate-binding protein